jgi:hypothetical protein
MFGSTRSDEMTFLVRAGVPLYRAQIEAHALDAWRRAEALVCERWRGYLHADRLTRAGAYAAYLTALSAEATAASRLQLAQLTDATAA